MTQLGACLLLVAAAAVLLTGLRLAANAYNEPGRQIFRGLRKVLQGEIHAFVIDYGGGRGVGFNFNTMMMATTWDAGAWCLPYRVEELLGVELVVDDRVEGWAFAKGQLWAADADAAADKQVTLRHLFDDPHHPHFALELWSAARAADEAIPDARTAVDKGNRWLEGMAALMTTVRKRRFEIDQAA